MKASIQVSIFLTVIFYKHVYSYLRVCYYTNWSQYRPNGGKFTPDDIDPKLCSHIIYAFGKLEGNVLVPFEWNDDSSDWSVGMYEKVNNLKATNPDLRTLLAVGGWNAGSTPFSDMVATRATRRQFINSTLHYLRKRNFDGFDMDWEYPARRGGRPEDKANLVLLLSEMKQAFEQESYHTGRPRMLLTAAVPAGKSNIDAGYDIPNIARSLDFINIMSYDLHGSWESRTGHNSPLFSRSSENADDSILNMEWAVKYWAQRGAPKHKLVVGIGLYGRSFKLQSPTSNSIGSPAVGAGVAGKYTREPGFMSYYEICEELQKGATRVWQAEHRAPYLHRGDLWVGYDDEESVISKVRWMKQNKYGGIMVWSLALDDFSGQFCNKGKYPLLTAINKELGAVSDTVNVASQAVSSNMISAAPVAPTTFPTLTNIPFSHTGTSAMQTALTTIQQSLAPLQKPVIPPPPPPPIFQSNSGTNAAVQAIGNLLLHGTTKLSKPTSNAKDSVLVETVNTHPPSLNSQSSLPTTRLNTETINTQPPSSNTHSSTDTHTQTLNTHPQTLNTNPQTLNTHPPTFNTHPPTFNTHSPSFNTHSSSMDTHVGTSHTKPPTVTTPPSSPSLNREIGSANTHPPFHTHPSLLNLATDTGTVNTQPSSQNTLPSLDSFFDPANTKPPSHSSLHNIQSSLSQTEGVDSQQSSQNTGLQTLESLLGAINPKSKSKNTRHNLQFADLGLTNVLQPLSGANGNGIGVEIPALMDLFPVQNRPLDAPQVNSDRAMNQNPMTDIFPPFNISLANTAPAVTPDVLNPVLAGVPSPPAIANEFVHGHDHTMVGNLHRTESTGHEPTISNTVAQIAAAPDALDGAPLVPDVALVPQIVDTPAIRQVDPIIVQPNHPIAVDSGSAISISGAGDSIPADQGLLALSGPDANVPLVVGALPVVDPTVPGALSGPVSSLEAMPRLDIPVAAAAHSDIGLASVRPAPPSRPRVNISFSSSSSSNSSSSSSSSSSNSSSSSSVNLGSSSVSTGNSLSPSIQDLLSRGPVDIHPLPADGNIMSVVDKHQGIVPGGTVEAVIPIDNIDSLAQVLANLRTSIPTAGTVLIPEPRNDLRPETVLRELDIGNILGSNVVAPVPIARIPPTESRLRRPVSNMDSRISSRVIPINNRQLRPRINPQLSDSRRIQLDRQQRLPVQIPTRSRVFTVSQTQLRHLVNRLGRDTVRGLIQNGRVVLQPSVQRRQVIRGPIRRTPTPSLRNTLLRQRIQPRISQTTRNILTSRFHRPQRRIRPLSFDTTNLLQPPSQPSRRRSSSSGRDVFSVLGL